ncbi:MAG: hypothetical protein COV67_01550, partial [Nitrospinae bacterium CG11_big_fil_rev_8_21_14_0_20_56_8]
QTQVLADPRLHLVFGNNEEEVAARIQASLKPFGDPSTPFQVLFHNPSFQCLPPEFPRIATALEMLLMERRFPTVLGDKEEINYLYNQNLTRITPGINRLKGTHQGRIAVLASAGPSLDNALPYLRSLGNGAVIACVDTALSILSREGIVPDYVFSLDPQDISIHHFRVPVAPKTRLIFTPTVCAQIAHGFPHDKFVVFKEGHRLFREKIDLLNEKGTTPAGGSVACMGLDVLIQMGCNPILLTGQDCAFTGGRTYSRWARTCLGHIDQIDRVQTLDASHLLDRRRGKQLTVQRTDGGDVPTSQVMYGYLRGIEEIAREHPDVRIYNVASQGARIDHVSTLGSIGELVRLMN